MCSVQLQHWFYRRKIEVLWIKSTTASFNNSVWSFQTCIHCFKHSVWSFQQACAEFGFPSITAIPNGGNDYSIATRPMTALHVALYICQTLIHARACSCCMSCHVPTKFLQKGQVRHFKWREWNWPLKNWHVAMWLSWHACIRLYYGLLLTLRNMQIF